MESLLYKKRRKEKVTRNETIEFIKVNAKEIAEYVKHYPNINAAARHFGLTQAGVYSALWRAGFCDTVPPSFAARMRGEDNRSKTHRRKKIFENTVATEMSLDNVIEYLIKIMQEAKKVPNLEQEVYKLQNIVAAQKDTITALEKTNQGRINQEQAWKVALQNGDILPLSK